MSPGTYLKMRREAAAIGVIQAAASLHAMVMAPAARGSHARTGLALRLTAAEEDRLPFTARQAELLASVFRFDVEIYLQLVDLQADPHNPDLPHPAFCRGCACSWHDACVDKIGPCAWAEHPRAGQGGLCTACVRKAATASAPRLVVVPSALMPA